MAPTLASPTVLTKSQLLCEQLKRELAISPFAAGAKFYSVDEVSRRFSVSPATAQKVVAGLVKSGYLSSQRGRGYFLQNKPRRDDLHAMFKTAVKPDRLVYVNVHTDPPSKLFEGLQGACEPHGYRLEVLNVSSADFLDAANDPSVAGLIVIPYHADSRVAQVRKPKISIGHWPRTQDADVISFIADAEEAGAQAVSHLCGLRHERIALIAAQDEEGIVPKYVAQLIAGFRRGYQKYGLNWSDDLIYVSMEKRDEQVCREFLDTFQQRGITAAMMANWGSTATIYREFVATSRRFPDDLSIIGYGHHAFQQFVRPQPMTHFDLKMRAIAQQAAKMLIEHVLKKRPLPQQRYVTFPVDLLVGESTAMRNIA